MNVSNVNAYLSINNMYNALYQSNMAQYSNRLNKSLFPTNQAQGMQSLSSGALQYVNDIKASSSALSSSIGELSGPAFQARTVTSSNTEALTVNYTGNRPNSVTPMNVRIDQTAAGQQNEGARMASDAAYEGTQGTNTIAIDMGGRTTEISVDVADGQTNQEALQRMADAINNTSNLDIRATVETNAETNTSILRLESTVTGSGEQSSFTVRDVTGEMASQTGANEVSREGRDAVYSVNGGETRTSQSNTVNLGNGVSATFLQASAETVTIEPTRDTAVARNAIEDMVRNYNNLFSTAVQNTDDPRAQSLASRLTSTSGTYSRALSEVGIEFDSSGRMMIDEDRLNQAQDSGRLERFFTENTGRNYGFTNQMSRLADNVSRNTSNFVSSTAVGSSLYDSFAYSGFGDLIQYNFLGVGSIMDFML